MSFVTSIILTSHCGEEPDLSPVEAETDTAYAFKFVEVSQHAGGGKAMQGNVWLAAVNYANHKAILEGLKKVRWEWPEGVSLFMQFEHGIAFEVVIDGGKLTDLGHSILEGKS